MLHDRRLALTAAVRDWLRRRSASVPPLAWVRRQVRAAERRGRFTREFDTFRGLAATRGARLPLEWSERIACFDDATAATGFDAHYVYHTAWAARVLAETRPAVHVDISSSLYFCAIVSAFVPVRFYDYRPANLGLSALTAERADLADLPFPTASIESLSCMHVVEHMGLGRYGDPLDPDGDLKAVEELRRVLAPGGSLLFVVPVGRPTIRFNAHRIYSYRQIMSLFDGLPLVEWALIPDDVGPTGLIRDASEQVANAQKYGCGCFWFRRPALAAD